jgi:hypothetical protein
MTGDEAVRLARARGERWLPTSPARSIEEAARFVDEVGFASLFPNDRLAAPSLWDAVAGPDAVPFAQGMGEAESSVWTWKDALPDAGLAWSGKFLHRRASLLSPRLLAALYPGAGDLDDDEAFALSPEARGVAGALRTGPLPSSALRELVGHRGRYDRAIQELQRLLLVTSAGVREQRSGWPAVVLDLTCRRFDVGDGQDHRYATARFLDTMVETAPAQLARSFGWPAALARAELEGLVAAGSAVRSPGGYRASDVELLPRA